MSGVLSDFTATNVDEDVAYENINEYISDLKWRDKKHIDCETFYHLKADLSWAAFMVLTETGLNLSETTTG